ncbi:protein AAR2 homolog [Brevipalpus obovatus]|uniref:protein AAR2 homolog n=1 Tax=Brevipalpus obovatus TaxID=246614 RepID=UPI003D9DC4E6
MSGDDGLDQLEMDPDLAKRLVEEGSYFLLLDFPLGSSVGIDLSEYNAGEKFKGFKMIPPGLHFIHFSAVSSDDFRQSAPRTGFFHVFNCKEVLVRRWDAKTEDISDEKVSDEEIQRYKADLFGKLDQFLAPYPFKQLQRWVGLSDHINSYVIDLLNPLSGRIVSVTQMIPLRFPEDIQASKSTTSDDVPKNIEKLLPNMKVEPSSQIKFSELNKFKYPSGSSASELTQHILDSTYCLTKIMSRYSRNEDILGELQFAFLTFIAGQVYDSFEHWKAFLKVICNSGKAMADHTNLYMDLIRVLHFQLREVPEDLFVDIVANNNFLVTVLRDLFQNISNNSNVETCLKERAFKFKKSVTKKYRWDFDNDPDDEQPVVVDLSS